MTRYHFPPCLSARQTTNSPFAPEYNRKRCAAIDVVSQLRNSAEFPCTIPLLPQFLIRRAAVLSTSDTKRCATIDQKILHGHMTCVVGNEKQHGVCDVHRLGQLFERNPHTKCLK